MGCMKGVGFWEGRGSTTTESARGMVGYRVVMTVGWNEHSVAVWKIQVHVFYSIGGIKHSPVFPVPLLHDNERSIALSHSVGYWIVVCI